MGNRPYCFTLLSSQRGFSLTEMALAAGLMGIFVLATSQVVITGKKIEGKEARIHSLDREHLISVQRSRNIDNVVSQLQTMGVNLTDDAWRKCITGTGTGCITLGSTVQPREFIVSGYGSALTSSYSGSVNGSPTGPSGPTTDQVSPYASKMEMSLQCPFPTACNVVKIRVTTSEVPKPNQISLPDRVTEVVIPGPSVASRGEMAFDCSNGAARLPTGVDFSGLTDQCTNTTLPAPSCPPGSGPIQGVTGVGAANCQPLESLSSCAGSGVGTAGIFQSQSGCAPAPSTVPPPTIPIVPPGGTGCSSATLSWSSGSSNCSALVAAEPDAQIVSAVDMVGPDMGSSSFQCRNGAWSPPLASPAVVCNQPGNNPTNPPGPTIPPSCQGANGGNSCGDGQKTCVRPDLSRYCMQLNGASCGVGEAECNYQTPTTTTVPPPAGCWMNTSNVIDYSTINGAGYPNQFVDCSDSRYTIASLNNGSSCTVGDTCELQWKYGQRNYACQTTCGTPPTMPTTTTTMPPACLGPAATYFDVGYTCGFEATFARSGTDGACCSGNAKGFCGGPGTNPEVRCSGAPVPTTTTVPPACAGSWYWDEGFDLGSSNCDSRMKGPYTTKALCDAAYQPPSGSMGCNRAGFTNPCSCFTGFGTTTTTLSSCAANNAVTVIEGGSDATPCGGTPARQANPFCCSGYDAGRMPSPWVVGADQCTRICVP